MRNNLFPFDFTSRWETYLHCEKGEGESENRMAEGGNIEASRGETTLLDLLTPLIVQELGSIWPTRLRAATAAIKWEIWIE